jgi:hypothetical protein
VLENLILGFQALSFNVLGLNYAVLVLIINGLGGM